MKLSLTHRIVGLASAVLLLTGPGISTSQAGLIPGLYESVLGCGWHGGYGYGASYGPSYGAYYGGPATYTAGYGGGGGCGFGCLSWLFHGCGLFGGGQPAYSAGYSPGCCYAPTCGTGCCGVSSGYAGVCSNGCGSGDCVSGDCGISSSPSAVPYSGQPVPDDRSSRPAQPSTPSNAPNRTYREEPANTPPGGNFQPPQVLPGQGQTPGIGQPTQPTQPVQPPQQPGGFGSGVLPPQDNPPPVTPPDSDIERGDGFQFNYKIPAREPAAEPATAEPSPDDDTLNDSDTLKALQIESRIAFRASPERRRAAYRAVFRTPSIARARVTAPADAGWMPIEAETRLAGTP